MLKALPEPVILRKERDMASKDKEARLAQKAYWQDRLDQRLNALAQDGKEAAQIEKDSEVRRLRALVKESNSRLKTIEAKEAKKEEMSRIKAERLAAPKEEKTKKKKGAEEDKQESKRQQKKKKKKAEKQTKE